MTARGPESDYLLTPSEVAVLGIVIGFVYFGLDRLLSRAQRAG